MSINKKFADIVFNSLDDVDEIGDDIILESELYEPKLRFSPFSPIDLPQGHMIISQTFIYEEQDEEDGEKSE